VEKEDLLNPLPSSEKDEGGRARSAAIVGGGGVGDREEPRRVEMVERTGENALRRTFAASTATNQPAVATGSRWRLPPPRLALHDAVDPTPTSTRISETHRIRPAPPVTASPTGGCERRRIATSRSPELPLPGGYLECGASPGIAAI
jgi:hypothetical protein